MKLQSNKNTITSLSLLSCLACLLLGTSTSAAYASLPEESFSYTTPVASASVDGQKSLAEFGQVLGQRLAGVWQEVRGLVGERVSGSPVLSLSTSSHASADQAIPVSDLVVSSGVQNHFSDITAHPHARYINLLAKEGVVLGHQGKFYPDNYLRLYDLIKMTVDLYRLKVGYSLSGEQGLSLIGAFSGDDSLPSRYVATALHLGFFPHVTGDYSQMSGLQRFVSSQDINQVFVNISYQFSGMIRPLEVENDAVVARGEAAEYLVMAFDVTPEGVVQYHSGSTIARTPFTDSIGHQYQSAISILADLGVVSTSSNSFYPDNYLHRYDFIIMLVNASLVKQNKKLSSEYMSGFVSPFVDIHAGSYSPFVYYAYDKGLLDYLTVNKRGQDYFLPENLMTKHEVYTLLAKATGKSFTYDVQRADAEYMSRGELAQILVDLYGFTPAVEEITPTATDAGTGGLLDKLSTLLQIKELLAKL